MSSTGTRKTGTFMGLMATVLTLVVLMPSAAQADLNAPISGSTYSDADVWYTSSNYRTVTYSRSGQVRIQIDSFPKLSNKANDQLKWKLVVGGNERGPYYLYDTSWRDLGLYQVGAQFRNKYARYTTCPNCNHNFSGNMDY